MDNFDEKIRKDYVERNQREMGILPHDITGPREHEEAARNMVKENPLMAVALGFAIPAWTAAKALGIMPARSPATADEIFAGYEGLYEGLTGTEWVK